MLTLNLAIVDCVLYFEGNAQGNKIPPSSRSFAEILASIQRSKLGVQDWSLSDLTIGLYLIYLKQASTNPFEDVKGVKISSDTVVSLHGHKTYQNESGRPTNLFFVFYIS